MRISKGLLQAYTVQDITFAALTAFRDGHKNSEGQIALSGRDEAQALLQLVKAWETAQDRVRIQRGKPLPGALKHETKRKPTKSVNPMDIVRMVQPETPTGTNG